jgi:hypothetical protein
MQRLLISLFSLFFLLTGPASVWADCFRHVHETVGEGHHHGGASDSIHAPHAEPDHSAPWFHCPQTRFDLQSLVSLSAKSNPKPQDHEFKLAAHPDLSAEETSMAAQNRFISGGAGRFPRYPFLVGLSPHLLLSVFRI